MVLKDHNVEVRIVSSCHYCSWISDAIPKNASTYPMSASQVLSDLLADLDACDSQKGDTKVLANGEVAPG